MSAFSFLNDSSDVVSDQEINTSFNEGCSVESGFNFLSSSPKVPDNLASSHPSFDTAYPVQERNNPEIVPISNDDLLGPSISTALEIKLSKTAVSRPVKKKKRAPRVGLARADDDGDGEEIVDNDQTAQRELSRNLESSETLARINSAGNMSKDLAETTEERLNYSCSEDANLIEPRQDNVLLQSSRVETNEMVQDSSFADEGLQEASPSGSSGQSSGRIDTDDSPTPSSIDKRIMTQKVSSISEMSFYESEDQAADTPTITVTISEHVSVAGKSEHTIDNDDRSAIEAPEIQDADLARNAELEVSAATVEIRCEVAPVVQHSDCHDIKLINETAKVVITPVSEELCSPSKTEEHETAELIPLQPISSIEAAVEVSVAVEAASTSSDDTISHNIDQRDGVSVTPAACVDVLSDQRVTPTFMMQQANELSDEGARLTGELAATRQQLWEVDSWLVESQSQLASLETEQQRLAAEECFEQAAALSDSIEELGSEILSRENERKSLIAAEIHVIAALDMLRRRQSTFVSDMETALKQKDNENRKQFELSIAEGLRHVSREESRLRAELDRTSINRGQLDRESAVLTEEELTVSRAIEAQSAEATRAKEDVDEQLTVIDTEIAVLEALLATKREQQRDLLERQQSAEQKIGEVRRKFDRQLQRIREWRASLTAMEAACQQEEAILASDQTALEKEANEVAALQERVIRSEKEAEKLAKVIQITAETLESSAKVRYEITTNGDTKETDIAEGLDGESAVKISSLQSKAEAAKRALSEARAEQSELSGRADSLGTELRELEDRLPRLEAEKKAHAAARRFKEAAASAAALRDAIVRKDELTRLIDETAAAAAANMRRIAIHEEQQAAFAAELREANRLRDISHIYQLTELCSSIHAAVSTIEESSNELPTEQISGSIEPTTPVLEGEPLFAACVALLDAELKQLQIIILSIRCKHGLLSVADSNEEDTSRSAEGVEIISGDSPADKSKHFEDSPDNIAISSSSEEFTPQTTSTTAAAAATDDDQIDNEPAIPPKDELMRQVDELTRTLDGLSAEIESAVEAEDYELAAAKEELRADAERRLTALQTQLMGII